MAKRPLLFLSKHEKILRSKSEPVKKVDKHVKQLIDDLRDTLEANPGVGLAAVQIGVLKRVFLVRLGYYDNESDEEVKGAEGIQSNEDSDNSPDNEPVVPPVVFINPEILETSQESERGFDGCLSIPGLMAYTDRHQRLKVRYLDEAGKKLERELTGWDARMFEHEYDHLNGVLFLDRLNTLEDLYVLQTGPDGKTKQVPYLKVMKQAESDTSKKAGEIPAALVKSGKASG